MSGYRWQDGTALDPFGAALAYTLAGLSVMGLRADGSKAPTFSGWRKPGWRASAGELAGWFAGPTPGGVGVLCGAVSGNLAVLDVETGDAYDRWLARLTPEESAPLGRCPVVRTPGGGAHVWARLPESVKGTKLARDKAGDCLVETRGDGHYVVAPGSPAAAHPAGVPYRFEAVGWLDGGPADPVPVEAFYAWIVHAAGLNEWVRTDPPQQPRGPRRVPTDSGPRVGDRFNAGVGWDDILPRHGWKSCGGGGSVRFWTRPGKDAGISASTGHCRGPRTGERLYVWTSSAPPFEPGESYSKFGAVALLEHGGDWRAAARALSLAGFGREGVTGG